MLSRFPPSCILHRSRLLAAIALLAATLLPALAGLTHADGIDDAFTHPPETARPLVYWFWMGRNVTAQASPAI